MRGSARKRMAEDAEWANFFQKGRVELDNEENVQLSDELIKHKKGEPFLYESELVQEQNGEQTEDKSQKIADEVQGIMDEQAREDFANVQLGYMHIPHAEDTEDIVEDSEKSYDHHHSKEWNQLVDQKAQELEDDMKAEEAKKIADKKAAEEAKRKAIEEKAKAEAEKRKQAQQLAQQKTQKKRIQTVDFNDIYSGISADEITLQTDAQLGYERHSKFWNDMVEQQTAELEKTIADEDAAENKQNKVYGTTDELTAEKFGRANEQKEQEHHFKTVDMGELYDGMALQIEDHSKYWESRVSAAQRQLEAIMRNEEEQAAVHSQENTSLDQNELYNGMALQTGYDNIHSKYYYNQQERAQ